MTRSWIALFGIALAAGLAGLLAGVVLAPLSPWAPEAREQAEPSTAAVAAPSEAASPEAAEEPSPIPRGPLPEPYAALLDSFTLDLDADGADEVVELFAAVEEDEQGRRMWDDGQRWMLRVFEPEAGQGWVLFDDFVQLGRLSFRVVETTEPPPELVVELSTGAGVRVWSLRFDAGRDAFVEGSSVAAHGNVVHETPADLD